MTKDIVGRECRFALHLPAKYGIRPDVHLVKERVHYADGTIKPNIRYIKNYQRPFYVTKSNHRNHKDKKEWEHTDHLHEFKCTQSELRDKVANALGLHYTRDHLKKLSVSPYLYGSDISSTSWIKKHYMEKYSQRSPYEIAYLDIETVPDAKGNQRLLMVTVLYQNKISTFVMDEFLGRIADPQRALSTAMSAYIPEYNGQLEEELVLCKSDIELITKAFARLHEWSPDFVAIWNMDFDISVIIKTIQDARLDPKDILSDPNIPADLRYFKYVQGKTKRVTASGKVMPISPASRWHTLYLTAGFYVLDAMCVYKLLRLAEPECPSYALDAILKKEGIGQKLKFDAADHVSGINWHLYMQEHYPVEYIVYNRVDVLRMQELERKIKDLSFKIPEFAGITDFDRFNSQPKKITDALYCKLEKEGYILGTVGYADDKSAETAEDSMVDSDEDPDQELTTLSLKDWILTLPADMQVPGLKVLENAPDIHTNIRAMVADSDAVSAYPTATCVLNVSKETTERELIEIQGVHEQIFRMENINLMSGPVNAIEYTVTMFNAPKPQELLARYLTKASY